MSVAIPDLALQTRPTCERCRRTGRIPSSVGLCRWCVERLGADARSQSARTPIRAPISPEPFAFEPARVPVWLFLEFFACVAGGLAFAGAVRFVTETGLHGLDLRGLLPLSTLPHVVCFGVFARRAIAWSRRSLGLSGGRLQFVVDGGIAFALAVATMFVSWTRGPETLARAASTSSLAFDALTTIVGVDVNARDAGGYCALTHAAEAGDVRAAEFLLDRGAEVDPTDTAGTPLTHAASKGRLELVKLLVAHGASLGAKNLHGLTPLDLARKHERPDVAAYLDAAARNDGGDR